MKRILVIAPHADDEILGCGGTMSKYILNGDEVYIAVMTDASEGAPELFTKNDIKKVRNEALLAHKSLGIKETFFFNFPAPKLDNYPSYLISLEISKLILKLNIEVLYIPHRGDIHNDHKIIFDASLVAARPTANCFVKSIYTYETLSETEWSAPYSNDIFFPNHFEVLDEKHIENKIKAMSFFSSQLKEYPNSRSISAIKILASYRGICISKKFAEGFMVIRQIS